MKRDPVQRIRDLLKNEFSLTERQSRELQLLTRELFGSDLYGLMASVEGAERERLQAPLQTRKRPVTGHLASEKACTECRSIFEAHIERIEIPEMKRRLSRLESLLNDRCPENEIHAFLAANASILFDTPVYDHFLAVSKPRLGDKHVPDFGLFGGCNGPWWTFLEIEKPSDRLFTDDGDYSAKLFHAIRQVHDWQIFVNTHY